MGKPFLFSPILSDMEKFFRIFQGMEAEFFCGHVHIGSQGFYDVGNILGYIGPGQVESPGGGVR